VCGIESVCHIAPMRPVDHKYGEGEGCEGTISAANSFRDPKVRIAHCFQG